MTVAATARSDSIRVFLSYSRKDAAFCERLASALAERFEPIYDQSTRVHDDPDMRLTAQDEWWAQLKTMIAACETMVFVVSPNSAASQVCDDEIAHARTLGKRVIPILRREIDFSVAPERLRALNVRLDFRDDDDAAFAQAVRSLSKEIEVDIDWHRYGARLSRLAQQWDAESRPDGQLLRAGEISKAEDWAARRPASAPVLGQLVAEFIAAGREKERIDRDRLLTITGRAFVKPAREALDAGACDAALRYSGAGTLLGEDLPMILTPERGTEAHFRRAGFEDRTRSLLRGHRGRVSAAAFSPDGLRVMTASHDHDTLLWDLRSGTRTKRRLRTQHKANVNALAFSPDGASIVTASDDETACVSDTETGLTRISLNGHQGAVIAACFDPNGARILTASADMTARIWDATSGAEIFCLTGHQGTVPTASFSADGARVVTASLDGTARVWETATGRQVAHLVGHESQINAAMFSPNGAQVLTASHDGTARLWDATTGVSILEIKGHQGWVHSAAFDAGGGRIVTASADKTARVWDASTGTELARLVGHSAWVNSASFCPDGGRVVTASDDKTARIWDSATGEEIARLLGHINIVTSAAFDTRGVHVLTTSFDTTARIWDSATNWAVSGFRSHERSVIAGCFNTGGEVVALSDDGTVRTWNVDTNHEVSYTRVHDGQSYPQPTALSPDGAHIVRIEKDGVARIFDVAAGAELACLGSKADSINSVIFSPDGARIVSAGDDEQVRIWNVSTGAEIGRLHARGRVLAANSGATLLLMTTEGQTHGIWDVALGGQVSRLSSPTDYFIQIEVAAFSIDGSRIVTGSRDNSARVWDTATGNQIAILEGHSYGILAVAFSADGARVATGSGDRLACVWDAETGALIARLTGHEGRILAVGFSADGARLVTASDDKSVGLWDISRTIALAGPPALALAAALANGKGKRPATEVRDLLMQMAPEDLYEALVEGLTKDLSDTAALALKEDIHQRRWMLAGPLHPNCYLSPSQRSRNPSTIKTKEPATPATSQPAGELPNVVRRDGLGKGAVAMLVLTVLALGAAALLALERLGALLSR